jgi:hypothetical protein
VTVGVIQRILDLQRGIDVGREMQFAARRFAGDLAKGFDAFQGTPRFLLLLGKLTLPGFDSDEILLRNKFYDVWRRRLRAAR